MRQTLGSGTCTLAVCAVANHTLRLKERLTPSDRLWVVPSGAPLARIAWRGSLPRVVLVMLSVHCVHMVPCRGFMRWAAGVRVYARSLTSNPLASDQKQHHHEEHPWNRSVHNHRSSLQHNVHAFCNGHEEIIRALFAHRADLSLRECLETWTPHACVYAAFRIPPKRAGIGLARSEEDTRIVQADAPPPKTQSKKHLGYEVSGRNE